MLGVNTVISIIIIIAIQKRRFIVNIVYLFRTALDLLKDIRTLTMRSMQEDVETNPFGPIYSAYSANGGVALISRTNAYAFG